MPQTLALWRWRKEDHHFEASLGYIPRPHLKKQTSQAQKPFPLFRLTKLRKLEAVGRCTALAVPGGTVGHTLPKGGQHMDQNYQSSCRKAWPTGRSPVQMVKVTAKAEMTAVPISRELGGNYAAAEREH